MYIHMVSRAWCFTLNNYDELDITQLRIYKPLQFFSNTDIRYCIFGKETGESGTKHLQGYIELSKPQRLSGMKKILDKAHWEIRRGSREQARDYCKKDGDFEERGDWEAGGQGTRNDLRAVMEKIKNGDKMINIIEEMPEIVSRNLRFVEKYNSLCERENTKEFRKVEVHAYVGDAGTGKTKKAMEENNDVFVVNCDETFPFDGYDGEKTILLDDFYGGMKYGQILRILDGHQCRVNVKGGHRYAQWTKVIITSNKMPELWYSSIGLTPALKRRLTTVTEFRNEEGGNTIPPPLDDDTIALMNALAC